MFELIVNLLTDSTRTSMSWAVEKVWGNDGGPRFKRIVESAEVGCSTHHCPDVRTI